MGLKGSPGGEGGRRIISSDPSALPRLARPHTHRERLWRLFDVVVIVGVVNAAIGLIAWPLGWWTAAYEAWAWFPSVAWSMVASLMLSAGLWNVSRQRPRAALALFAAAALVGIPGELVIVDDGFVSVAVPPANAPPELAAAWGHAAPYAIPVLLLVSTIGILIAFDRAPRLRSALLTALFVGAFASLASALYQVGSPVAPYGSVVGPFAGVQMLLAATALAVLQPDLPPISWLPNSMSAAVFALVGVNILLVPAFLHVVANVLSALAISPAGNVALVVVIGLLLVETFFAAQVLSGRDRWNRVVAVAAEGVLVLDQNGRITDANSQVAAVFGRTAEQLKGQDVWQLSPPRLREFSAQRWRDYIADPRPMDIGPRGVFGDRDGAEVPLAVSLRPVRDSGRLVVIVGIRDATEAIALQDENEEIRALLADTTDLSLIGSILVEGPHGTLIRANDSFARMLGYDSPEQLLGRTMVDLCHPDDVAPTLAEMSPVALGQKPAGDLEHRFIRRDGSTAWGHVLARALRTPSGRTVVSVQVVDTSERVLAEQLAESALADLEHRARHDALTGLLNRASVVAEIDSLLARRTGPEGDFAVLYCDLDNFKFVNDEYSHEVGDELLVQLARRLRQTMRPTDLIARIAGDEFVLVLPDADDAARATGAASRMLAAVARAPFDAGIGSVNVSMSVGIALSSQTASADSLLRASDIALHAAKEDGRSQYRLYDANLQSDADKRLRIAQGLSDALASHDIGAWFQPVVAMADGRVVGYEALARWHSEGGDQAAHEWIAVADEVGLLGPVGEQVLDKAIGALARLPQEQWVAVNVAGSQISPATAEGWLARLADAGVSPDRLVVEMREQSLMRAPAASLGGLHVLRAAGVGVFFDDFGTGASSVAALGRMPVSGVKLDREFTATLHSEGAESRLASALAGLATELGLTTIAEGVETAEQRDLLLRAGWELGQGWYFGRPAPLPVGELEPGLRRRNRAL